MNETYVITVLMLYVLVVLIDTLLNTYRLLVTTPAKEKELIELMLLASDDVQDYEAPLIWKVNFKKDHLLNKKRRPPIILVAH